MVGAGDFSTCGCNRLSSKSRLSMDTMTTASARERRDSKCYPIRSTPTAGTPPQHRRLVPRPQTTGWLCCIINNESVVQPDAARLTSRPTDRPAGRLASFNRPHDVVSLPAQPRRCADAAAASCTNARVRLPFPRHLPSPLPLSFSLFRVSRVVAADRRRMGGEGGGTAVVDPNGKLINLAKLNWHRLCDICSDQLN